MGRLPERYFVGPLTVGQKFAYLEKPVFGPRTIVTTAIGTAIFMAHPPSGYPHEWRAGAGAFGRNYGNAYARREASAFARFSFDSMLHEDPRYYRSTSKGVARLFHAIGFTFVDRTDGGHATLALANFAGAAASGIVGNAYLPDGFDNGQHARSRSVGAFGGFALQNVVQEFSPEISRAMHALHIPKLPLPPVWWTGN